MRTADGCFQGLPRSSMSRAQEVGIWSKLPFSVVAWLQLLKLSIDSLIERLAAK